MSSIKTLKTENEEWGFYGTLMSNGLAKDDAHCEELYADASAIIINSGFTPEQAREALDSTDGRHVADQIADERELEQKVGALIGWFRALK